MSIKSEHHGSMASSISQRPNGVRVLRMQREILLHPESRVIRSGMKLSSAALSAIERLSGQHATGARRNVKPPRHSR